MWTRCSTHAQATKLRHVTLRVRAGAAAARAARSECCSVSRRRGTAPQPQGAAALIEEATAMAAAGRRRGHTPGLAGGAVSRGGAEDRLACEPRCAPAEPCYVLAACPRRRGHRPGLACGAVSRGSVQASLAPAEPRHASWQGASRASKPRRAAPGVHPWRRRRRASCRPRPCICAGVGARCETCALRG